MPTRNAYSETFIAKHVERLRSVALVLSDGRPPWLADDQPLVFPRTIKERARSLIERKVLGLDQGTQLHKRTVEFLLKRKIQVVLAEYGNMGEALLGVCMDAGIPMVAHFHGYDAHRHAIVEQHHGYQALFAHAAAIVVVSRSMEDRLLDLGAPREKLYYNCYGIDVEHFTGGDPEHAPPHFVGVGRFVEKKAAHLTILAFKKVLEQVPDARLTLVGDGVLRPACAQLLKALGIEGQVDLPGVQGAEVIASLMAGSRAFVQHSVVAADGDSEGTPLAVLEAMATGIPVVATRHAGISDVVDHGVRGLLGGEYDVDAMAANMIRVAQDPAAAGALGRAGRAYVEQYHRAETSIAALQGILDAAADQQ